MVVIRSHYRLGFPRQHQVGLRLWRLLLTWTHLSHYWSFVRGIHRTPVVSQHKGKQDSFDGLFVVLKQTVKWPVKWNVLTLVYVTQRKVFVSLNRRSVSFTFRNKLNQNFPVSQMPQCIRQIPTMHHIVTEKSYKVAHCGIWDWCIVGYRPGALWYSGTCIMRPGKSY